MTATWILAAIIAGVLSLTLLPRIRELRAGARLNSQLLTGEFDESPLGRQFGSWFRERPSREIQRQRFVQLASAMGCPSGQVGDRVMRSIMRAWKEPQTGYGSIVAEEINDLIAFDSPTTDAQKENQRIALSRLEELKSDLRRLDLE